jgi:hypothetical protein
MDQAENNTPAAKGFFHTLAGAITSVAAIITAFTGLIIALNQAGCFHSNSTVKSTLEKQAEKTTSPVQNTESEQPASEKDTDANTRPIRFTYTPAIIKLPESKLEFKIQEAKVEELSEKDLLVTLKVKCISDVPQGYLFGSGSFRLQVGEDKYAPINFFSEVIPFSTFLIKDLQFKFPRTQKATVLLLDGDRFTTFLELSF